MFDVLLQQTVVDPEELGAACSTLEHAFGAYVSGVAEFESLYAQVCSLSMNCRWEG